MANRGSHEYKVQKAEYLAKHDLGGYWACMGCGRSILYPELDHKQRTGMGGSPSRLLDVTNWQILGGSRECNCHGRKDSGFKHNRSNI